MYNDLSNNDNKKLNNNYMFEFINDPKEMSDDFFDYTNLKDDDFKIFEKPNFNFFLNTNQTTNFSTNQNESNNKDLYIELLNNEKQNNEPIILSKKRLRKEKYTGKNNYHTKFNSDNCRTKIKSHFNNFIIDFFNKLIFIKYNKQIYKFRKLSYDLSKHSSKKFNKKLLNTKIKDILRSDISKKYKNINSEQNIYTLNKSKIKKDYNDLLEKTYLEFYEDIYLPDNSAEIKKKYNIDKNEVKGCFNKLISKLQNSKNNEYKDKILFVAKNEFKNYFLSKKNIFYLKE